MIIKYRNDNFKIEKLFRRKQKLTARSVNKNQLAEKLLLILLTFLILIFTYSTDFYDGSFLSDANYMANSQIPVIIVRL